MGRDANVACKTCKRDFYLGYMGYNNSSKAEAEFKSKHNQDHEMIAYSTDYCTINRKTGALESDFGGGDEGYDSYTLIEDFKDYERIDLTKPPEVV